MKDQKIPRVKGSFVINLDIQKNSGTHWVCAIRGDKNVYFDSFGLVPPESIVSWMDDDFYFSDVQYQPDTSEACGYYAVYMIKEVSKGRDPLEILNDFEQHPSSYNDDVVVEGSVESK